MKRFILVVLLIIVGLAFLFAQRSIQGKLLFWGVNMDLPGFAMTSFMTERTKAVQEETLEARSASSGQANVVRITRSKVENNQKLIDDRIYLLKSLFVLTTSPYPEVLSNNITCPEEFKPKEIGRGKGGGERVIYTLFAGERFNFGVCSQDLIKYKAVYGIFDCGGKGVFEVKMFGQDINDLKSTVALFSCRR